MKEFKVLLNSINDVKDFVRSASSLPCDIDVVSGRYVVDAKSLLGMFSLDPTKPVLVQLHGTDADATKFAELIKNVLVGD